MHALKILARLSHHPSTATTLCRTLHDFSSVRALDIVSTMPAHSSVAKARHGATCRHLATKAYEISGLGINFSRFTKN